MSASESTPSHSESKRDEAAFAVEYARITEAIASRTTGLASEPTTSTPERISASLLALPSVLPSTGIGLHETTSLLLDELAPALSGGQAGPRFFGLVTGGVTPAALLADHLVSSYDPCVQVHLPGETISTTIETRAIGMVAQLLDLPATFIGTFTTGATASNLMGLLLGREYTINRVKRHHGETGWSVAEDGFGGVEVDVFVAGAHASIAKAASMAGIGRRNVHDLGQGKRATCCDLEMEKLEERLRKNVGTRGSIVVATMGEVSTGGFCSQMERLRKLCDTYQAWLHIDAAFGAFACLHPDFDHVSRDLALADSITSDAHKWLNTPYDCGIFLTPHPDLLRIVFGPGKTIAPYLSASSSSGLSEAAETETRDIPSPLHINIENSRRFRALPVYASLVSLGREGYAEIIRRNIDFARKIVKWMRGGGGQGGYQVLLPPEQAVLNIVLYAPSASAPARFQGTEGAKVLQREINASKEMYVTGTNVDGRGAIRLAVSNYSTEMERDYNIVVSVLERVMQP